MNLRELLSFNIFLQLFDGTASYFILSRGESELNPFVSAAIDAWGLLWALVYRKVFVCALLVILYSLWRYRPTPDTARLDLRGHSLFGARLVPSFPFDSLRLMKGKIYAVFYIDCSCRSSLRRHFRRLLDEPRPALGLPAVPIRQPG